MAVSLLHKYNATAGTVPTASTVKQRELAINTADGVLYTQKTDGTVKAINPLLGIKPQTVVVDMGAIPLPAYSFAVTVPGAQLGMVVMATISVPLGYSIDEMEMEPMTVHGLVIGTNVITFSMVCPPHVHTGGSKIVNFYVG